MIAERQRLSGDAHALARWRKWGPDLAGRAWGTVREDSLVMRVTAHNRGRERAPLHLIPQLWFRNTWAWDGRNATPPVITATADGALLADDSAAPPLAGLLHETRLGPHRLELPAGTRLLFTDNETNGPRVFGLGAQSRSAFTKEAFHRRIVDGDEGAVNP